MSWEYIRLGDVCAKIGSGATPKGGSTVYIDEGTSFIRSQNIYNLEFSHEGLAHITEDAAKKLNGVAVQKDDVLINITGDSVARTCMVPDAVLPARVNQHVAIVRPDSNRLNPRFLNYYLASPYMQSLMLGLAIGKGASRNAMTKDMIANFDMKCAVNYLRRIPNISSTDVRFILCAKFFLFYLFDENPVVIKPTIDREKCVICTRGKNTRVKEIKSLIDNSTGTEDEKHEAEFLLSQLVSDSINDTSITIPASILVYQKDAVGKKLCEFDGMIIHLMRKTEQVFFLEAKNRNEKPVYGKNCLREKLDKFPIQYNFDDIQIVACDAYFRYTVQ